MLMAATKAAARASLLKRIIVYCNYVVVPILRKKKMSCADGGESKDTAGPLNIKVKEKDRRQNKARRSHAKEMKDFRFPPGIL